MEGNGGTNFEDQRRCLLCCMRLDIGHRRHDGLIQGRCTKRVDEMIDGSMVEAVELV